MSATIVSQRDLVTSLKRETYHNIEILSKISSMSPELTRHIFNEDALEKPTQHVFNHLSHYLVSIIDVQKCATFSWPLYDTKTERNYRNEFASFIADYSSKGLLSPVMSSYLVNPGCYKVVLLVFQLSQLAVKAILLKKMKNERQKKLYADMNEKRELMSKEDFVKCVESELEVGIRKLSSYTQKRESMEVIAEIFRKKITQMEKVLQSCKAQIYLENLVDGYLKQTVLDNEMKEEILKIKDSSTQSKFFNMWLDRVDLVTKSHVSEWVEKTTPILKISKEAQEKTEYLISRFTGEADKKSYMIEFNPKTNDICTTELQNYVNSEQKYILKNIIKDETLYFPNLIRSFIIAICYIFKNTQFEDDVYYLNEYLQAGCQNYNEISMEMKNLIHRVMKAEDRLQVTPIRLNNSDTTDKLLCKIPPLPDLSNLEICLDQSQVVFDTFTPFTITKHQFNLRRRGLSTSFVRPQPKSLITAFHPNDVFLRNIKPNAASDRNISQNIHNLSVISQVTRVNETIAECSVGFTNQQLSRLFSTKKSSLKKIKFKTERPEKNIKRANLFNESNISSGSNGLYRSYSSPNLFENKEKRPYMGKGRKLSIMQEDNQSLLDVSGISRLGSDSGCNILQINDNIEMPSMPVIRVLTPESNILFDSEKKIDFVLNELQVDLNKEIAEEMQNDIARNVCMITDKSSIETKVNTPKNLSQPSKKSSSIEKIINRFKKVKANVLHTDGEIEEKDIKTIVEEKENINAVNVDTFTANRILLPDLLSPNCSLTSIKPNNLENLEDNLEENLDKCRKKGRQSLGTMLGVDHTFLDQFDLVDSD